MLAPIGRLKGGRARSQAVIVIHRFLPCRWGGVGWGREGRASCEGGGERTCLISPRRQDEHVAICRKEDQIGR